MVDNTDVAKDAAKKEVVKTEPKEVKPKAATKAETAAKNAAAAVSEGKNKALGLALESIEKQFGKGSIMKLGDSTTTQVETIPTGSISLDLALGGGLPKGRVVEVYGPESSGKT